MRAKHKFKFVHGAEARTILDVVEELEEMNEEEFKHHVNQEKNDIADWAKYSLDKPKLAERLRKIRTKEKIKQELLEEHISISNIDYKSKEFMWGIVIGLLIGVVLMIMYLA